MTIKPKIGISACLAGERVRFNAGNVRADWIMDSLGKHVDLVPLCPEMAMGLSVPREAMRLSRPAKGVAPRLVTSLSGRDMTDLAEASVERLIHSLPADLDGYVLMGRSPLCGVEKVKVYDRNGIPQAEGAGIFAARLKAARPDLVVCEAGRLSDPVQREHFVLRLFRHAAVKVIEPRVRALQEFHKQHKFILLAHGPSPLRRLGRIAATAKQESITESLAAYRAAFFEALSATPKPSTMADALTHLYGFLKDKIDGRQKQLLRSAIEEFRLGTTPLLVPLSMLKFANELVGSAYVTSQALLAPYPEMGLRRGI